MGITVLVIIMIVLLFWFVYYNQDTQSDYQTEHFSYSVVVVTPKNDSYELLLPFIPNISKKIAIQYGNVELKENTSQYGPCLILRGVGNSSINANESRRIPLDSRLDFWNYYLTMTSNYLPKQPSHLDGIKTWIWSGKANISLNLSFYVSHGIHKREWGDWSNGESCLEKIVLQLNAGWSNVNLTRIWIAS